MLFTETSIRDYGHESKGVIVVEVDVPAQMNNRRRDRNLLIKLFGNHLAKIVSNETESFM